MSHTAPEWDLFPESRKPFSASLFVKPGNEYRATPLWSWNDKLDQQTLIEQIDDLEAMGFGGFHMHTRVGLDTEYLGPEHMNMVCACVDYAKKKGMKAWLYDEDRWPSGFAGGKITDDNESFRSRHLLITPWAYGDPEYPGLHGQPRPNSAEARRSELGTLLARYSIELDGNGYLVESRKLADGENAKNVWHVYEETNAPSEWFNGGYYVDTLNKEAMRAFIAATHEVYKSAVGDEFGKSIPAIFTDEPQFAMKKRLHRANSKADVFLPWTLDLQQTYKARYGEDLFDTLPEIIWDGLGPSKARYNFHDHVCDRFVEAFTDLIAEWCTENSIGLTGHMMYEDKLSSQTGSLGEAMRCYRRMQLPGIDMLCDAHEYTTAKQAQSVSRQYGRCGVISEIYGVTNWTFTFAGHKGSGDWQAALGVNVRCPHLAWYSMAGEAKRDYPATISYQSPWYKDYPLVEDHFARVHYAMSRGIAAVRVAVIHPIESFWLAYGPNDTSTASDELEQQFERLTNWLCHGLIDFDFISESLLLDMKATVNDAQFCFGHGCYDMVVIPTLTTIRSTTLDALESFTAVGGRVVVAGPAPEFVDSLPSKRGQMLRATQVPFTRTAILDELASLRDVRVTLASGAVADSLLYQMRIDGDERYVFLCNTDRVYARQTQLEIHGEWAVTILDTMTGDETNLEPTYLGKGSERWTTFPWVFDGCGSVLVRLQPEKTARRSSSDTKKLEWNVAGELELRSMHLSEPNVLLLDMAKYRIDDEEEWSHREEILRMDNIARKRVGLPLRQDNLAQPYRVPKTQPKHTIHLRYDFEVFISHPISEAQLALEGISESTVVLDGQPVPSTKTGWWVDKSISTMALPTLQTGQHVIEISMPFGERTNIERVYVLGSFGVELRGRDATIVDLSLDRMRIGDYTRQGLPFYAGDVRYIFAPISSKGRTAIQASRFSAPVLRVEVNGKRAGRLGKIAFPPHILDLGDLPATEEEDFTISVTAVGNRNNAFGALHLPDGLTPWYGPDSYRTNGNKWTYEYNIQEMGLIAAPRLLTADPSKSLTTWDAGSVDQDLWFH